MACHPSSISLDPEYRPSPDNPAFISIQDPITLEVLMSGPRPDIQSAEVQHSSLLSGGCTTHPCPQPSYGIDCFGQSHGLIKAEPVCLGQLIDD